MAYDLEFIQPNRIVVGITGELLYSFEYQLALPVSSKGERRSSAYKTVKTEDYVWNGLSLTGQIGGILSMTLQFSFISAIEYLIRKVIKVNPTSKAIAGSFC